MEVNPGRMRQQPSAGGGGRPGFGTNALPPRWDDRKKIDCSFLHAARQLAPLPSSRNRERRLFYSPAAHRKRSPRFGPPPPQVTCIRIPVNLHPRPMQPLVAVGCLREPASACLSSASMPTLSHRRLYELPSADRTASGAPRLPPKRTERARHAALRRPASGARGVPPQCPASVSRLSVPRCIDGLERGHLTS